MPLFDIIKDPIGAEAAAVEVLLAREVCEEVEPMVPSEVDLLRASAREVDARETADPEYAMDADAEAFLAMCLARAQQSSVQPYRHDPEIEDGYHGGALRVVAVAVRTGEWSAVLNARESAIATVTELARRGFGLPRHDYRRVAGQWELRIRFSL